MMVVVVIFPSLNGLGNNYRKSPECLEMVLNFCLMVNFIAVLLYPACSCNHYGHDWTHVPAAFIPFIPMCIQSQRRPARNPPQVCLPIHRLELFQPFPRSPPTPTYPLIRTFKVPSPAPAFVRLAEFLSCRLSAGESMHIIIFCA